MEDSVSTQRKALATRVASGSQLTASPKLRSFFLYVVDCAIRDHPEEATEQQIGVKVFGRRPGYSSGDDSIVRSQARLLRFKLAAYFAEEGKAEPLIIEMPKGRYLPVFHEREEHAPAESLQLTSSQFSAPDHPLSDQSTTHHNVAGHSNPDHTPADHSIGDQASTSQGLSSSGGHTQVAAIRSFAATSARRIPRTALFVLLALALGLAAGAWIDAHWSIAGTRRHDPLWSSFLGKTRPTLVIYSNPLFHGTPANGLQLVDPDAPPADHELDDETYTGTGEAAAVKQLTRLFDAHNADFVLKRSRLVTWDEARSANLIFVGAPSQNTALHELPALSEFAILLDPARHGFIVNQHPRPGEPLNFPTNDKTQETAIIALAPGLEAGTHILILSGLTTVGTQMAVEYVCRAENIASLAQQAGTTNGDIRPFEAVLQIGISKGVGINAKLLLLHRR